MSGHAANQFSIGDNIITIIIKYFITHISCNDSIL